MIVIGSAQIADTKKPPVGGLVNLAGLGGASSATAGWFFGVARFPLVKRFKIG